MYKKIFVSLLLLIFTNHSYALKYNFGTVSAEFGKWLQSINPFALNTPEKRADDFYENATNKEFDCVMNSLNWVKLSSGRILVNNMVYAEARKLPNKTLLFKFKPGAEIVCSISDKNWESGEYTGFSACLLQNNEPLIICKRTE